MARRERADLLLVSRGLAPTRHKAQALIMAGKVFAGGKRVEKPGVRMPEDTGFELRGGIPYVSRGGLKLEAALKRFGVDPTGAGCLDVGASTGGFTDCLLQHGAAGVHAVDVGYGQLDWKLRNDPRVTVVERTNFRIVGPELLPGDFQLAVVDVSFISLRLILPSLKRFLAPGAEAIVLVKPQFEAGRGQVGKGGIVRDEGVRARVLEEVEAAAVAEGFQVLGRMESPIRGADGNLEYLAHLRWEGAEEHSRQKTT